MKIVKKNIFFASIVIFLVSLSSCNSKIDFLTSTIVPAARGYVTMKKDNNDNYLLHIKISNLAESTRLTPSKATYVVWIVDYHNHPKNIGQIETSKLKASLETVSPFKPNKVFISAEDAVSVEYPADTILTTANF
ncbi:MAG: hypothetical protein ABI315_01740 [Bacteroidia bacterium]